MVRPQGDIVENSNIHHTTHLTDAQRIDWLWLIRSDNIGPRAIMARRPQAASPCTDHLKGMVYALLTIDGVVSGVAAN